ncbi:unnamed protein product, partial [Amoebophrya sp. A120]
VFSSASVVRCPNPAYFESDTVSLSLLVGNPAYLRISSPSALFTYIPRFGVAHITPEIGSLEGGTKVRILVATRPMPLAVADLQCVFGNQRVPAQVVAVEEDVFARPERTDASGGSVEGQELHQNATNGTVGKAATSGDAEGDGSSNSSATALHVPRAKGYHVECETPSAANLPRVTDSETPCACSKYWTQALPSGDFFYCNDYCCTVPQLVVNSTDASDLRGSQPWCQTTNPLCDSGPSHGGVGWGYCKEPTAQSSFPVCVRILETAASFVQVDEIQDPCWFQFNYFQRPYLDFVSPPSGPNKGGSLLTLHVRNVPRLFDGNALRCRFESYVTEARWVSDSQVQCVTPSVYYTMDPVSVDVYLSVNGGEDYFTGDPTPTRYTFVPTADALSMAPDFGPQMGGTAMRLTLPTYYDGYTPSACCFGVNILVTAVPADTTGRVFVCSTPPWYSSPAVVPVGLLQADGSCDLDPQTAFTYV